MIYIPRLNYYGFSRQNLIHYILSTITPLILVLKSAVATNYFLKSMYGHFCRKEDSFYVKMVYEKKSARKKIGTIILKFCFDFDFHTTGLSIKYRFNVVI